MLIVGIGASAGGLEAFKSFFTNTPPDTGMAFVLVQHLSPDHNSMLAELIGRTTPVPVIEATDGTEVKPNCVFVIPPDATMTIAGGRLMIVRPAPPRDRRRPIDTFFQSLAADQGENAIGIILAGTGSDGSLGLTTIKEQGGLTLAQAEFDHHALPGMPQSAAATGQVDDVLPVEGMPARLVAYRDYLLRVVGRTDAGGFRQDAASNMTTIMGALRARSGHDFTQYKQKTLLRRLQRRMQVLQVESPAAYIERFRQAPEELDLLFRELLIGVTQFFRDPPAFDALASTVLKGLMAGKGADDEVRVWVPGCATGEEVFTIAILLREAMDVGRPMPKVQVFGTDIDERAVAVARLGRYPRPVAGLSPERAERWFIEDGGSCCVAPDIRQMCVFSAHSIIKHPPFSRLDLISCRNLLIYIDPGMQDRVMRTFHYALKPAGTLFLGTSESVTRATRLFGALDKKHRIYQRREIDGASLPDLPARAKTAEAGPLPATPLASSADGLDKSARRAMEKYYPPHVVVDRRNQILHFSGAAMGPYIEPPAGAPNFALLDVVRKSLRAPVRAVLQEVRVSHAPVRHENIPLRIDGHPRRITVIAEPLADRGAEAGLVLLAFQDGVAGPAAGKSARPGEDSIEAMKALEQDLLTTRTQLQSTIDELETASEEMKSSNEEYQSVNEELQSSNEELETSKEEMQSLNEELQTINAEMVSKNEQLTRLNSDLGNLLESTEIATLFLDDRLLVKRFTRGVADIFHIRDADIGRPITDIVGLVDYAELQRDVKSVLRKLAVVERQVTLKETGATFLLRIHPYRTTANAIDGAVLTFVDISQRAAADEALRQSEQQFRALADTIPQLAWIMDAEGSIHWYNQRWFDYTGTNLADMQGWGWRSVQHPDEVDRVVARLKHSIETGEPWEDTFPLRGKDGRYRWFLSRMQAIRNENGQIVRWFGTNTDIEDQKHAEQQRTLLLNEMDHRIKNLFAIVGGMVTLSARSAASPRDMAETIQGRLGALAKAHLLIRPRPVTGEIGEVSASPTSTLNELVQTILSPYVEPATKGGESRVAISGPEVVIGGKAATSLALILHEMATNATKYGAFAAPDGHVGVSWTVENGQLALVWEERGGPAVLGAPKREGFGGLLARRSAEQLDGELAFDWNAGGLIVRFSAATERLGH